MKHRILVLAALLAVCVPASAPAQTPAIASMGTDKAPFGCDARAPNVCHFQIFYPRGGRLVVLPAGMKATIPEVKIGRDGYCVALNKRPSLKCARKTINATNNH
jgi:hypothetical protein